MADPDGFSWMVDDDTATTTFDAAPADGDEQAGESNAAVAAEAVKPPGLWRTTYKLAVSLLHDRHRSRRVVRPRDRRKHRGPRPGRRVIQRLNEEKN